MLIATIIAIVIYLVVMVGAGAYAKRWVTDSADCMLAGREFGFVANVMELCAVALAGSLLTFVPSLVLGYGLKTAVIGYIFALGCGYALYGLLYGKIARDNGSQTVAEYLELRYNVNVRTLVAIASSITMSGITANNVLAIGSLFSGLIGFPTFLVTSICFVAIIIFSLMSGFWGITLTDMIQVVVGAVAFIGLAVFLMHQYGGMEYDFYPVGEQLLFSPSEYMQKRESGKVVLRVYRAGYDSDSSGSACDNRSLCSGGASGCVWRGRHAGRFFGGSLYSSGSADSHGGTGSDRSAGGYCIHSLHIINWRHIYTVS